MSENEEKFYDLDEDTIEFVSGIVEKMALPFNIKIKYIGSSKLKGLIKLQKLSDIMSHMTSVDLLVYINEDYMMKLEDNNAEILIHQELDRIQFDISKGTFKLVKFELQTTTGVLKKYGIDDVAKANQLSDLYTQQVKDGASDEFDVNTTPNTTKKVEFLN